MKKYTVRKICALLEDPILCVNCGFSGMWKPCNVIIPDYIPEEQVRKFLYLQVRKLETKNDSKILY